MAWEPPPLIAGLDIGQVSDPTALAILHRDMVLTGIHLQPRYGLRQLQRLPLGLPYPQMVRQVREYLDTQLLLPYVLVLDVTGVGRGIYDLFREVPDVLLQKQHGGWEIPASYRPIAVSLTGGERTTNEGMEWHVPKREVVLGCQVVMQQGRLQMARALPEASVLIKEIQQFAWKVSAHRLDDQYAAWREGAHDDLLLATALAVWWGERTAPRSAPATQQTHAVHAENHWLRQRR